MSFTDLNWSTSTTSSDTGAPVRRRSASTAAVTFDERAAHERAGEIVLLGHRHGVGRARRGAAACARCAAAGALTVAATHQLLEQREQLRVELPPDLARA